MDIERVLKLSDNQTVNDEAGIRQILAKRNSQLEQSKTTSPADVLGDVDFSKATLSRQERNPVGVLEVDYGGDKPFFQNQLYEIPDITIDLTPEAEGPPRNIMSFRLLSQVREVTIDVLFDSTHGEYSEHYGDDETVGTIVEKNLLEALQEKNWQFSTFDAWSVEE